MNSLHHHLWNTGKPIEPETTRLLNVVPNDPGQLPEYLFSVPTEGGWAIYVKKPELPKSEFHITLCPSSADVVAVCHIGTDHCPYDKMYSAVIRPELLRQFKASFYLQDKPTNLYILRGLQFERDPDSDMDTEMYWTLRAFDLLLGAVKQCD
jgi:hypothetical protein